MQRVFEVGDVMTFPDVYRKRTFWQWLTRQPRVLQEYRVTATTTGYVAATPIEIRQ